MPTEEDAPHRPFIPHHSIQCPFCGTWSNTTSPTNCLNDVQANKCAWNVKPQPVRSFRKIGDVE